MARRNASYPYMLVAEGKYGNSYYLVNSKSDDLKAHLAVLKEWDEMQFFYRSEPYFSDKEEEIIKSGITKEDLENVPEVVKKETLGILLNIARKRDNADEENRIHDDIKRLLALPADEAITQTGRRTLRDGRVVDFNLVTEYVDMFRDGEYQNVTTEHFRALPE